MGPSWPRSKPSPASGGFRVEDLAAAVRSRASEDSGQPSGRVCRCSLGGAVGFALALEPGLVERVITIASAPQREGTRSFGTAGLARTPRRNGTARRGGGQSLVRPGFAERSPDVACELLRSLADADDASYALACEALAQFDLGARMSAARIRHCMARSASTIRSCRHGREWMCSKAAHTCRRRRIRTLWRRISSRRAGGVTDEQ